jgi:WD40 repeat protein
VPLAPYAAFTTDGGRALTGGAFTPVRLWDVGSGSLLRTFGSNKLIAKRAVLATLSRDGTRVITTYTDSSARVWDSGSGHLLRTTKGDAVHSYDPNSRAALSPDDRLLVTPSEDVWDVASGRRIATRICRPDGPGPVTFSPDGKQLVACGSGALLWDVGSRRVRYRLNTMGWVNASAFSPDGRLLVTGGYSSYLWDAGTGRRLRFLDTGYEVTWAVAFSPDGGRVVVAGARDFDGVGAGAHVWDLRSGRRLIALRGHADRVISAAFSSDGTKLLTVADDCTARTWDAANGQPLHAFRDPGCVGAAAFSPDGTRILIVNRKGIPSVFDVRSNQLLRRYLP